VKTFFFLTAQQLRYSKQGQLQSTCHCWYKDYNKKLAINIGWWKL